jgi:phenylpropionate dioxygenase-like ring-hydroxylating dioxygenase large terminal subunit
MALREEEHDQLPIPNGWFAVDFSHELREGDVKPINYFGEEMVLFRTRSGEARIVDAFCPHLGAHLAYGGRVMGDTVRCPFHGWQFDGETGECTAIPYCQTVPPQARVRAWPTQEKNGMVWAWYHSEQKPPEWDFPALPEFGNPDWSEPRAFELELEAHVQETHENNNDPVHFQFVHGMAAEPPGEIKYSADGRHYQMINHNETETPFGTFNTSLVRDSWGLGLTAVRTVGIENAGLLMFSSASPIDETHVHFRWLMTATRNWVDLAGEEFMKGLTSGVQDDFDIWKYKVHRARPVLCEGDTYLADYRKWARQFYTNPVA